ncbi:MAG: DUF6702 family protein [Bacteroidota bacterium]
MTAIILTIVYFIHPFHVSVTDIKFIKDKKSLQISSRIFLDDLELALQDYTNLEKLDIMDENNRNFISESINRYLHEKIILKDGKNREYKLVYLGMEIEDDVMWCYLEVEKVKKIESIIVTNKILHEVWSDQENLVHFRAFDSVKSARLFKGDESKTFEWN